MVEWYNLIIVFDIFVNCVVDVFGKSESKSSGRK